MRGVGNDGPTSLALALCAPQVVGCLVRSVGLAQLETGTNYPEKTTDRTPMSTHGRTECSYSTPSDKGKDLAVVGWLTPSLQRPCLKTGRPASPASPSPTCSASTLWRLHPYDRPAWPGWDWPEFTSTSGGNLLPCARNGEANSKLGHVSMSCFPKPCGSGSRTQPCLANRRQAAPFDVCICSMKTASPASRAS